MATMTNIPQKLWVRLVSHTPGLENNSVNVATQDCVDVDDFIDAVKKELSNELHDVSVIDINLHCSKDSAALEPDVAISDIVSQPGFINSHDFPLFVIVQSPASFVPRITATKYKYYKRSTSISSSRAYLISVAEQLLEIYPISDFNQRSNHFDRTRPISFKDIIREAYGTNPAPRLEYRCLYTQRLKDFFTEQEWNALEDLDNIVNPQLRMELGFESDRISRKVILPIEFLHLESDFGRIAKKTLVVANESHLIVKIEGDGYVEESP